jgi:hypothetical protein
MEDTDTRLRFDGERTGGSSDGVWGNGFSTSRLNSLNILSSPGAICLEIIRNWFNRSANEVTSFFGVAVVALPFGVFAGGVGFVGDAGCLPWSIVDGFEYLIASGVPIKGLDM